jgi:hypothetical protein
MPQISLYVDQDTLSKIEKKAHRSHTSISKWVGNNLKRIIDNNYPEDYFSLFGSINDDTFERPGNENISNNIKRVKL